jgi:U3 small nucleolar RNA-associated protein 4
MVSLAVHSPSDFPRHITLRNSALWYPVVPPPTLCPHEDAFVSQIDYYTKRYRPLVWCNFGGIRGEYLSHLTRITLSFHHSYGFAIDFNFDQDAGPEQQHRSLGRPRWQSVTSSEQFVQLDLNRQGEEHIFEIDLEYYDVPGDRGGLRKLKVFPTHLYYI